SRQPQFDSLTTDTFISEFRRIDRWQAAVEAGITVVVSAGNGNRDANTQIPAAIPEMITVGASTEHETRASFSNFGTSVDIAAPGGADNPARANDNLAFNVNPGADANYVRQIRDDTLLIDNILSLNSSTQTRYEHRIFNFTSGRINSVFNNTRNFNPSASDETLYLSIDQFFNRPNTSNQYKSIGGTSMAAPHVAGAAALILAANPELSPEEVRNILVEEADVLVGEADLIETDRPIGPRLNVARAVQRVVDELEQAANPVTKPRLLFPANGTDFIMTKSPGFRWLGGNIDPANGGSYRLFIDGRVKYEGTATSFQSTEILDNKSHIWSVGACDRFNSCEFSNLGSFTISKFNKVPEIISPDTSISTITGDIDFEWSNLGTGITYNYQVIERNGNTGPQAPLVADETGTTNIVINLSPANYQFKVQACFNSECGAFRTSDFTIESEPEPDPDPEIETNLDKAAITSELALQIASQINYKRKMSYRIFIANNAVRKINASYAPRYRAARRRLRTAQYLANNDETNAEKSNEKAIAFFMNQILHQLIPVSEFIPDVVRDENNFTKLIEGSKTLARGYLVDGETKDEYLALIESFKSRALPQNPYSLVDFTGDPNKNITRTTVNNLITANSAEINALTPLLATSTNEELIALTREQIIKAKYRGIIPAVATIISEVNRGKVQIDPNLITDKLYNGQLAYRKARLFYDELTNIENRPDYVVDQNLAISFDFVRDWSENKPYETAQPIENLTESSSVTTSNCFSNSSGTSVTNTLSITGLQNQTPRIINLAFDISCQANDSNQRIILTASSATEGAEPEQILLSYLSNDSNTIKAAVINFDGALLNSWNISSPSDKVDPDNFGIGAVDIDEDGIVDVKSYFYTEKAGGIYLESQAYQADGTPLDGTRDSILVQAINHIDPPRPGPPDPVPETPSFLPPPLLEPDLDPTSPDPSQDPSPIFLPTPRAKPGKPRVPKVKPGPRKESPVINNPTKEDRVKIKDLLETRKNNSGAGAAEAGTNHQVIKDILDVIDKDS
ncbi:MAG: S8 family serine peptidase, partial [Candidatus Melainabacteria bacterium]|nr:S8 family serine peptidase [Candidatus Melainabacteria bacterium]